MPDINFTTSGILKWLSKLNIQKANGPEKLPLRFLKDYADEISKFLKIIFQNSYNTGDLPRIGSQQMSYQFSRGEKKPSTAITCKLMEHILHTHIIQHCDSQNIEQNCQHVFRKQNSLESQPIITTEELKRSIDQKKQVYIIILDLSKAVDTVAHSKLVSKLQNYWIQGKTNKWINKWLNFRNQNVVLDGDISDPVPVTSGVPSHVASLHQWHQPKHQFKN